jgi:cyanate permease
VIAHTIDARRLAALVVLVGVSCALHVGKLPVAIPVLRDALGMSLVQAGFLLSLVQLAGMTLGLLVGLLADRLGPRRVMLGGLGLLAMGSALGALSPDAPTLLATRVLEGMGFLLAVLPAPGLLRQRVEHGPTLSRSLGWWGAYMPLGTALALLLGVPLLGAVGWRGAWWFLALLSIAAAVALARWVPRDAPVVQVPGANALGPRLARTLRAPGPWLMALAFFLYSGQWLAVVGFLPTIYHQAGYAGGAVGVLTALAAGINMAGNIGAGWWLARGARPGTVLMWAYLAMGLGALVAFGAQGHPVWHPVRPVGKPGARPRHGVHHRRLDAAVLRPWPVSWPPCGRVGRHPGGGVAMDLGCHRRILGPRHAAGQPPADRLEPASIIAPIIGVRFQFHAR